MDIIIIIELVWKLKRKINTMHLAHWSMEHRKYTMTGVIIAVITVIRLIILWGPTCSRWKLSPPWCRLSPPETGGTGKSRSLANLQPSETTVNWNPGSPSTDTLTPSNKWGPSKDLPRRSCGREEAGQCGGMSTCLHPLKVMLQAL